MHATDPGALLRFKREFRTLADLTHPNLIALDELFNHGEHWFFTMDLVRGQPIIEYVRQGPPRPRPVIPDGELTATVPARDPGTLSNESGVDTRLRHAFSQLSDALQAIHREGIVHRDVKPSNVLVTAEGRTILLDFGVATQLSPYEFSAATVVGTPIYMAPEQVRNEPSRQRRIGTVSG